MLVNDTAVFIELIGEEDEQVLIAWLSEDYFLFGRQMKNKIKQIQQDISDIVFERIC